MTSRFKYTLSFVLLLSLIGLGQDIFISCPEVKNYVETELLNTTNEQEKDSSCFYYYQDYDVAITDLNVQLWSDECILYYNRKVDVKIISRTKLFSEISPFNLLINKSYFPRNSIEQHCIS